MKLTIGDCVISDAEDILQDNPSNPSVKHLLEYVAESHGFERGTVFEEVPGCLKVIQDGYDPVYISYMGRNLQYVCVEEDLPSMMNESFLPLPVEPDTPPPRYA